MTLNAPFPYSISYKKQILIAAILSLILLFIILFLKPLGSGNLNLPYKTLYFIGYSLIVFSIYLILFSFSNLYYNKFEKWKLIEELIFSITFIISSIIVAFLYTETVINKKTLSGITLKYFIGWFNMIFLGFGIILSSITILLRKYYSENNQEKEIKKIKIQSLLKNESFWVSEHSIAYIKSEDNYVHIYYFENNILKNRIIRNTLSNTQIQFPLFIKTHRSYIVNPSYINYLSGNAQNAKLYFKNNEITIPVSKTYFESIKQHIN